MSTAMVSTSSLPGRAVQQDQGAAGIVNAL